MAIFHSASSLFTYFTRIKKGAFYLSALAQQHYAVCYSETKLYNKILNSYLDFALFPSTPIFYEQNSTLWQHSLISSCVASLLLPLVCAITKLGSAWITDSLGIESTHIFYSTVTVFPVHFMVEPYLGWPKYILLGLSDFNSVYLWLLFNQNGSSSLRRNRNSSTQAVSRPIVLTLLDNHKHPGLQPGFETSAPTISHNAPNLWSLPYHFWSECCMSFSEFRWAFSHENRCSQMKFSSTSSDYDSVTARIITPKLYPAYIFPASAPLLYMKASLTVYQKS